MKLLSVVGPRRTWRMLAPVARALAARGETHVVVNAGHEDDAGLSPAFFESLAIARPDRHLEVGWAPHAVHTGLVMQRLDPVLADERPDVVLVYGDVEVAVAAALAAAQRGIRVAHVEAGLRSGDATSPEEIHRIVTDRVADLLFVPSRDGIDHLRREGVPDERIAFVGNVMIDLLAWSLPQANARAAAGALGVAGAPYAVVTLQRPANVDDPATLRELMDAMTYLSDGIPVVFPVHPRTRNRLGSLGLARNAGRDLRLVSPLGYLELLGLIADAALVITDSGGLQEETTYLNVPCLTVGPNTERSVTCLHGTNRLVPARREQILAAARRAVERRSPARPVIERWDGRAAERIAAVLCDGAQFEPDAPPAVRARATEPRRRRDGGAIPQPALS